MKNPVSQSLTLRLSTRRRSAIIAAACAVLVLGLAATGLLNVRAQAQSRAAVELGKPAQPAPAGTASQAVVANWPTDGRKRMTYDDYLLSLRGNERLTTKVITGPSENGNPTAVIVFYDKDGKVRLCIGKASACKELMS
jgi:hypothetical protein